MLILDYQISNMNEKEDRMNELSCSARITLPKAKNVSKIHFNHIHSETKQYIPKERVLVRNDYPNLSSIQLNSHDYLLVMGISTDQSVCILVFLNIRMLHRQFIILSL